jgi:hypothetical protein
MKRPSHTLLSLRLPRQRCNGQSSVAGSRVERIWDRNGRRLLSSVGAGRSAAAGKSAGPYGLTMPDYSTPPPKWPLPAQPPIKRTQGLLGPSLAGLSVLGLVYVIFNQDQDIFEYWKQVEQGNVPLDGFDDDDDDMDDDDDDDDDEDNDEL